MKLYRDSRKKRKEKGVVFKLHILLILKALAISLIVLVLDIGLDTVYFFLIIYFILVLIFDKSSIANIKRMFIRLIER
jgi:hypothetical protein